MNAIAFLSGGPGPGELIVVFVVVLVLFGPRRLPEIARMIGGALEHLRRASHDFRNQVMDIERGVADEARRSVYDVVDDAGALEDAEDVPEEDDVAQNGAAKGDDPGAPVPVRESDSA